MLNYALGIDVGGTNTDAVIMEYPSKRIVASRKTTTTVDFTSGILQVIIKIMKNQSEVTEHNICSIMIGTTTFLNAVIQNSSDLIPVSVIRLCGPASVGYPSFINFPPKLSASLKGQCFTIDGGFEFDGKVIAPLDEAKLRDIAATLAENCQKSSQPLSLVITGIFSPTYPTQELRTSELLKKTFSNLGFTNYYLTLSHQIAQIGLLEREGASILNAALKQLANKTVKHLKLNLLNLNLINCHNSLYFTQNDGTLISCERVLEFPVFTFNSGPTNSLRGACLLSDLKDAIIADIGGTSTDVAVLQKGQPRPAQSYVNVGGVRTNFRMPDTVSIGLGGGSLVKFITSGSSKLIANVGPKSIGYKMKESICFGGTHLTATDIAVAKGIAKVEGSQSDLFDLPTESIDLALKEIVSNLEKAVDSMKTSPDPVPLILVGGGSILIPDGVEIEGISQILRPEYFDVANAVGAAIAQVSAIAEDVIDFGNPDCDEVLEKLKKRSKDLVLEEGAIGSSVDIITDQIHVAYTPGRVMRVTCKAIGDIDICLSPNQPHVEIEEQTSKLKQIHLLNPQVEPFVEEVETETEVGSFIFGPLPEAPEIILNGNRKEWLLSETDLQCLAIGAGIMGTGGGGSPYIGTLEVRKQLRAGKQIRIINPDDLTENETVLCCAYYGAPLITIEKLGGADKIIKASKTMQKLMNLPGETLAAVTGVEIGGCNSLAPFYVAADLNLPVLDCDFMGRAFPEIQMITPIIYKEAFLPICMRDEKDNEIIVNSVQGNTGKNAEAILRRNVMELGCDGGVSGPYLKSDTIRRIGIKHTVSQIWKLGRDILEARRLKLDPLTIIQKTQGGKLLFVGKIITVLRYTEAGYTKGKLTISGFEDFKDQLLLIDFQNENLLAQSYHKNNPDKKTLLAVVPDLISMVDTERYQPILTEDLKYGLRVSVLFIPVSPLMKSEIALKSVGPAAFGYENIPYTPLGKYIAPSSLLS